MEPAREAIVPKQMNSFPQRDYVNPLRFYSIPLPVESRVMLLNPTVMRPRTVRPINELTSGTADCTSFSTRPDLIKREFIAKIGQQNAPINRENPVRAEKEGARPVPKLNKRSFDASTSQIYKGFLNLSWTFKKYMEETLYGVDGYYSSDTAKIGDDFSTAITTGECLSRQFVDQAFAMYVKMVEAGDISGDHFDIIECGAGTGELANKALKYIDSLKQYYPRNTMICRFADAVKYTIGEISPELRRKQAVLNQDFIKSGKLNIVEADARNLGKFFKKDQFCGVFISNELPDAFPVHCIFNHHGNLAVKNVIPMIHMNELRRLPQELQFQLTEESEQIKHNFYDLISYPEDAVQEDYCFVNPKHLNEFSKDVLIKLKWNHVYLPVEFYPEILEFLNTHPNYLEHIPEEKDVYLNDDADNFMKGVSEILQKGFVITVDYGNRIYDPNETIRIYPKIDERDFVDPNENFHTYFKQTDLTTGVHFHMLSESAGALQTLALCKQNDLGYVIGDISQKMLLTRRAEQTVERSRFSDLDDEEFRLKVDELDVNYRSEQWTALVQVKKGTKGLYGIPAVSSSSEAYSRTMKMAVEAERVANLSRLYANGWVAYQKYLKESGEFFSNVNYSILCGELYGVEFMPSTEVGLGLYNALILKRAVSPPREDMDAKILWETISRINAYNA